jgi:hypothetical protein
VTREMFGKYKVSVASSSGKVQEQRLAHEYPVPLFDIGCLLLTEGGGWRLLLFRWLAWIEAVTGMAYYQPTIWVEWVPRPAHVLIHLDGPPWAPPIHGALIVRIPLSMEALKGLELLRWVKFGTEPMEATDNDPPLGYNPFEDSPSPAGEDGEKEIDG